ncbi:MAG: LysM peptidoglycan-binding domain-containing protein [Verrucomicrobia bacterium]|nr:LysM peptidoglycan-binding domain-containing protein [Verrucomicrobiota bacterium]
MRSRRIPHAFVLSTLLALSGCGYVHIGRLPRPVTTVIGDDKLMKDNSDLRLEKKILQQELALTRAQGDALRMAIENRAADGDTSTRLVERLNETSRELAALRASYVKLQDERNQAVASAAEARALKDRLGATEEKLAASLLTYTQLQEEITRLRSDVDRTRAENVALGEQVKTVTAQSEQAQAALAQLNTELLAQKDARFRAEQDAETLRTELKSVAPNASALAQQRTGAAAEARSLISEHAAETAALKQQLDTLRAKVEALAAERAELKQQLAGTESAPRGPSPELANVEAKLANALRSASLLRDENEQLKAVSVQLAAAKSDLEGKFTQLRGAAPAAAQVQTLRDQLRDAQNQASALSEENARLKSRLAGAPTSTPPTTARAPSGVSATLITTVPGSQRTAMARSSAPEPGRFHVVTGGDTLSKISTQYYGTPGRWGDILAANRDVLGESNNLVVGRTLRIP